jgi:ribose transport system ATP-binding protein
MWFAHREANRLSALIPVLVTGIQRRRVGGAEESFRPKDLGRLDSCDKHRNEVDRG